MKIQSDHGTRGTPHKKTTGFTDKDAGHGHKKRAKGMTRGMSAQTTKIGIGIQEGD